MVFEFRLNFKPFGANESFLNSELKTSLVWDVDLRVIRNCKL